MRFKRSYFYLVFGMLVIGLVLGLKIGSVVSGDNTFQQLKKLEEAFSIINKRYVEDVDSAKLVEDAIEGMLEGMDPHSIYIDAERMQRVRENFDASFEGVGIYYDFFQDTLIVLMPITGGPSEKAGLMAGDRIVQIDEMSTKGFDHEDVQKHLKGPKGTKVTVTVRRLSYDEPLQFTITRDEVPIYTVDAAYMIDDETGYVKLNRFAASTYTEILDALERLRGQGMKRLVFDLRDNAGGYMEQAIRVVDEFLAGKEMIVYTRSRHGNLNQEYRATPGGVFEKHPIIVLVNEHSASASEIVAGALQDHDRALIVGRRTFGKGLVQQQFHLTDGSALQMTISRYYTPAGRLIQTPYENGNKEEYYRHKAEDLARNSTVDTRAYIENVPDSLKFKTDGGRIVFGGGGILPDFVVPGDTTPALVQEIIRKQVDDEFATWWLDRNGADFRENWEKREDAFLRGFALDDGMWTAFWDFAGSRGFEIVEEKPAQTAAQADKTTFTRTEIEAERPVIEARVKAHIARRTWGVGSWFPVIHQVDETLKEALKLWNSAEELALDAAPGR